MGNLLGHHPKPGAINDADRAVLSLRAQRRKLEEQAKLLEKRMEHQVTVARQLVAANKKDRALLALQRKKLAQRQLETLSAHLLNVEDLLSGMELTKQQARIFTALKDGAAALKKAQSEWTVDDVERLMEETADARDYQEKVHDVLSTQLAPAEEEAAADELAALEAEFERTEAAEAERALPAAPTRPHEAPAAAAEEEEGEQEVAREREPALVAA